MEVMYFGLAFLPAIAVVGSVASQSKTVSTFAQMGSVVSRTENEIDGVAQGDKSREKVSGIDKLRHAAVCTALLHSFDVGVAAPGGRRPSCAAPFLSV